VSGQKVFGWITAECVKILLNYGWMPETCI